MQRIKIAEPCIGREEEEAVIEVLRSKALSQGKKVREFEEKFASYIGVEHAIATSSGTAALHLALLASGIKKGDEVITTPFSFIATANAILYCNAEPKFADVDYESFNIDPESVKEKITKKTKALLIVHLYGMACDMREIAEICKDYNLMLIEDACQAHGAEYGNKKAGSFGEAACFSFYPTKNMTTGEGGMIVTGDAGIAEKAELLRQHGAGQSYKHDVLGYNFRLTDIAAAIGIEQLKKLDKMNERRIKNAMILSGKLRKLENEKLVELPKVKANRRHVFHQYTIKIKAGREVREKVIKELDKKGIEARVYYPVPIHRQKIYERILKKIPELKVAEKLANEVLSLPVHACLDEEQISYIADALIQIFEENGLE